MTYDMSFLGLGVTNWSVLKYMVDEKRGNYFVSSLTPIESDKKTFLLKNKIDFEEGKNTERILDSSTLMISPGIRPDSPLLIKASELGVEVKIDIELFLELMKGTPKMIAITGTNGKTTTVEMITHILGKHNRAYAVGNIGNPTFDYLSEDLDNTFLVFELSSFQIKHIKNIKRTFDIAGVTNLSEDHLDWHGSFELYKKDKMRISKLSDLFLIPSDLTTDFPDSEKIQTYDDTITTKRFKLPGNIKTKHNIKNATLAALCCSHLGVSEYEINNALSDFEFGEHRMEEFLIKEGRTYINDSKSTNAHSLFWALKSLEGSIILLAGAKDKGDDYTQVGRLINEKVKKVYLCGESAKRLYNSIKGDRKELFSEWDDAISKAIEESTDGDILLFSPGGSSFDKFKNYKERGIYFKNFVRENT